MVISTCGFGETGSSAVTDYLKECSGIQVSDNFEFTVSTAVDGLEDLGYFLMEKGARQGTSIYAIQRFEKLVNKRKKGWSVQTGISQKEVEDATQEFLDKITQVRYVGFSPRINSPGGETAKQIIGDSLIRRRIIRPLEKKGVIKKNFDFYPLEEVRVAIRPANFYEAAQEYVCRLLKGMGVDPDGKAALDQAFTGANPAKSFPYFRDPRAIVVDRDPRDVYIFAKTKALSVDRFMPTDTVENYIKYYRLIRDGQPYLQEDPRIILVRFESLIYEYEEATQKINDFLGVTNEKRKTVFVPEMSAANTNLITKYPEFKDDIRKIEEELPEYLFDFAKYPEISNSGKMFYGRSTKNPKVRPSGGKNRK